MGLCERYNIQKNEWTAINPMSKGKRRVSACMLGQHFIYAIGGDGDNGFLNDIEFYNIN